MAKKPGRKKAAPVDPNAPAETKADKFKRLGTMRVSKALKAIAVLGNLSNRSGYEYTEDQVNTIFAALLSEIEDVRKMFSAKAKAEAKTVVL